MINNLKLSDGIISKVDINISSNELLVENKIEVVNSDIDYSKEKVKELKSGYERELTKEKRLVLQSTTINEPISLVHQNESELSLIDEQLRSAYFHAMHSEPKKLILKRKPNKR